MFEIKNTSFLVGIENSRFAVQSLMMPSDRWCKSMSGCCWRLRVVSGHKIDICQGLPSVNLGVRVILTWFPSIPVGLGN